MSDSEKQLFEKLAIEHMANLYSSAIRLTRSAEDAEDLVQQTFAMAFCVFELFDRTSDFDNWLNEILMFIHKKADIYFQLPADNYQAHAKGGNN